MNVGAPAIPLRPVRVAPVLVDDVAVVRALRTFGPSLDDDSSSEDEMVRWARAWIVGWQAALQARGVIGTKDPWTVALAPADWPVLRGDPERRRQHAAADLLLRLGLADRRQDGALVLAEHAFVPHRAGLEVDWTAAFDACHGEPAALLTLRAVVDGLAALDDPGPITLRELVPRTGYGEKQVRTALHRLAAAGVLDVREAPGQPTRYRVTDALLGREARAAAAQAGPRLVAPGAAGMPSEVVAPPRPAMDAAPAFRLSLNGATVTLVVGLDARVDIDGDGVPHLHVSLKPRD